MPERAIVDTNVIVRLLTRDDPGKTERVARLLFRYGQSGDELLLLPSTVSEVVFVLRGAVYRQNRDRIVLGLQTILGLPIEIRDRGIVESAVTLYAEHHDNWDDCLVAAYALALADGKVVSFDRELDGLPGLARIEPA